MKNWIRNFLTQLGVWSAGIALGMSMVATVKAEVLVTHTPNPSGTFYISSLSAGQQNADFTFSGNASVTGIRWWGSSLPTADLGLFTVRIISGLGDNFVLESTTSPVSTPYGPGYSQFDLDLSSAPLLLSSGNFYLSIMNDSGAGLGWGWLTAIGGDGENYFRGVDNESWTSDQTGDFSLQLTGNAIPEPGSMALLLLAGTALLLTRRQ